MTEIDWSKAPAEATHYGPKREDNDMWCAVFWTVVNGIGIKAWQIDNKTGDLTQYSKPTWRPEELHRLIPRPTVWTGEGLPPVGIECERCWNGADRSYFRVKVLAHDGDKAVFRWLDGDRAGELQDDPPGALGGVKRFRPIRTPEQIAAEEREKAVKDMATLMTGHEDHKGEWGCYVILGEILYDAGYRKQEQPK